MKKRVIVLSIKTLFRAIFVCAASAAALTIICYACNLPAISALSTSSWLIEPKTPQNIDDPPFYALPLPEQTVPVTEVMKNGKEIPLQFAYDDLNWKRQAYKDYWDSSVGRWSYVPSRIHYAMHRLFVTYPTASIYYDFIHDLGIAEESSSFQIPSQKPYDNIVLVAMQTKVEKIVTLGNQVVVIGRPSLTGLQVLLIPVSDLKPNNPNESILFQLVTHEGDEIDYATETYVTEVPR